MNTKRVYRVLRQIARQARLRTKPLQRGFDGVYATQNRVVIAREKVTRLLGGIISAHANARARRRMLTARRKTAFAERMSRGVECGTVTAKRARVDAALHLVDKRIATLAEKADQLADLREYAMIVLEHVKGSKEVLKAQVDLIRDERRQSSDSPDGPGERREGVDTW